jgi:hypothetical protein
VRKVLVVEELRKAELELRNPEVERVPTRSPCIRCLLDEENVLGVVVDVRDRVGDLWKECDRVEEDRQRDGEDKKDPAEPRKV